MSLSVLPVFASEKRSDFDFSESINFSMDGWGVSQGSGPGSKRTNIFYSPSRTWEFGLSSLSFDYDLSDTRSDYRTEANRLFIQRSPNDVRITIPNIDDEQANQTNAYVRYSPYRFLGVHMGLGYRLVDFMKTSTSNPPQYYSSSFSMRAESVVTEFGLVTDYDISLESLIGFGWNVVLGIDWFMVGLPIWSKGEGEINGWLQDTVETNDIAKKEAERISYQYPSLRVGVRF